MQRLFYALLLLVLTTPAFAQFRRGPVADKAFDAVAGLDTRNYPPDPQVNFSNILLDIKMPEPMSRSFTCDETITFRTPGRGVDRLDLDAVDLRIEKVTDLKGNALVYRYDQKVLTIRFDPPLPADTDGGVMISYACVQPKNGMTFALPDDKYPDRPLSIHTQGETETNRYWFIGHDYPNAKQTSEIRITLPAKYSALSNGALVSKDDAGNGQVTYHYKLSRPHSMYLVSLVVGEFAVVKDKWRDRPVEYWVPPSQEANARRTFGKTPKMMEVFSKLTGFDYPWEKYAQAVVYNFAAGGMENTSATTLAETTTIDERAALDSDAEGLIAHELAHQWFGDTITCKSWPHIWLNEGFATFMDAVWQEQEFGRETYEHQVWQTMQHVAESDDPTARSGVVWPFYSDGGQVFGRPISNPYPKGAVVLHMLRRSMGDALFWKSIATFLNRFAFQNVETDDLRKVFDETSGRSYDQFFQQWIYRAGTPKIAVELDDGRDGIRLRLKQTQAITADAPAFALEVPVWIVGPSSSPIKRTIAMSGRTATLDVDVPEPAQVLIDPEGSLLVEWDLSELPERMLIRQALSGPTPTSRFNAIAALSRSDRADAREALKSILLDDSQHHTFRSEAALALGKMREDSARDILLEALAADRFIKNPRVRRAAVEGLGRYSGEAVAATLLRFADRDETYTVEAEASRALANQDPSDAIVEQLIANTKKESYRDQIRAAAFEALGEIRDERALPAAMEMAAYGKPFRTRPGAIAAIGKIGRAMKDSRQPCRFLLALIDDPQERAATAAMRALGELGDEDAIARLRALAQSAASEDRRQSAREAVEAIEKKSPSESAALRGLRQRVETLEKARERGERERNESRRGETKDLAPATEPSR